MPEPDQAEGRVTVTRHGSGVPFDWNNAVGDVSRIRSDGERAGCHRILGSWFYLDESDLPSKYSLLLVEQFESLLGGEVEKAYPVLTLPVGGTVP